jgi:hypothetical protein
MKYLPVKWLLVAGCSSAGSSATAQGFPADTYATTTSDAGALRIEIRTSPQPPTRGTNAVELTIASAADGSPVDGLTLQVTPWMPAMNHGAQDVPGVTAEGGGKYLLPQVDCFMPGHWELRTTFSGPMTDHATPALDVP